MDRNPASQLGHVVRIVRKTLDQFDIRFPASHSFISYPIACEAVQFRAPPTFLLSGGHTAFPIREWLCYGPGFKTRRILSCVLQEQEAPILRGNLGISRCKLEILKGLGLRGGGNRERTILHRRIPFNNPNLGPNWSLPVIRPEGVNECIDDLAFIESVTEDQWR